MKIDISKGRYWDLPWSLVDGCTPCSPGCDHCWSAAMASRFHSGTALDHDGDRSLLVKGGKFTGEIVTHPERLSIPLKRRKPTVYAVWNDLFHAAVDDFFIDDAHATIHKRRDHTFLVLTKRPDRMLSYYQSREKEIAKMGVNALWIWEHEFDHLYHGLTICNQQEANKKIPEFMKVPGKKFLSIEPMLGAVDLTRHLSCNKLSYTCWPDSERGLFRKYHLKIDAVILGGETGPGARPLHPDWVRKVRDDCQSAGVPFFFKQWGEWLPADQRECPAGPPMKAWMWSDGTPWTGPYNAKEMESGGNKLMRRVGRNTAGRLLDGRTHDELPWIK